jgi:OPA family glycerol-3-phosphate transporter-like MFS transporter
LTGQLVKTITSANNVVHHSRSYRLRRFFNWFPLGLTYSFLYMARYNLTVSKTALGELMTKADFGTIFAAGTITYAFSFLINGPLTDKIGGKRAMLIGASGVALMNVLMGVLTYWLLSTGAQFNLALWFSILYAINMYFQSYGAVAIVKLNSNWFHIRERGVFGGIFGILISLGLYFAFDWGQMIVNATVVSPKDLNFVQKLLRSLLAIDGTSGIDQTWWVFFVPAIILAVFALLDVFVLRDKPSQAGYKDFDTGDASSGEEEKPFRLKEIVVRIITNKILITIAVIEFCSGVMRNGIMHWYLIFTNDMGYARGFFVNAHWGLLLMLAGVFGGVFAGIVSDKVFGSRRGPVAALLYAMMLICTLAMWPFVSSTNNAVKDGFKVVIDHNRLAKYQAKHGIGLAQVRAKVAERYQVIPVDSTNERSTWQVLSDDKEKMIATKIAGITLAEYERYYKYQNKSEKMRVELKDVGEVMGAAIDSRAYILAFIVIFISLCVIGVHGMLSGTSTMDFGGRRAAATAVGLIDGFVYLGTGVQSLSLGFITTQNWSHWPPFLLPFALLGLILAIKIWHAFPNATRKTH